MAKSTESVCRPLYAGFLDVDVVLECKRHAMQLCQALPPLSSRIRLAGRFKRTVWFDPDERIRILRRPKCCRSSSALA